MFKFNFSIIANTKNSKRFQKKKIFFRNLLPVVCCCCLVQLFYLAICFCFQNRISPEFCLKNYRIWIESKSMHYQIISSRRNLSIISMYSSTISILLSSIQTVQTLMIRERQSILSLLILTILINLSDQT